jgi:hypothetical protein
MSRKPTDDAWDICSDYLEPLAEMLFEWGELARRSLVLPEYKPSEDEAGRYMARWLHTTSIKSDRLAGIWLLINVSREVAEIVSEIVVDAGNTVVEAHMKKEWPDGRYFAEYFRDLARVLRQREGKPISKAELAAERKQEADDFRGPFTVAELTNGKRKGGPYRKGLLGITRSTLYARKKKDPGMFREGIGGLFVHKSLLPNR